MAYVDFQVKYHLLKFSDTQLPPHCRLNSIVAECLMHGGAARCDKLRGWPIVAAKQLPGRHIFSERHLMDNVGGRSSRLDAMPKRLTHNGTPRKENINPINAYELPSDFISFPESFSAVVVALSDSCDLPTAALQRSLPGEEVSLPGTALDSASI